MAEAVTAAALEMRERYRKSCVRRRWTARRWTEVSEAFKALEMGIETSKSDLKPRKQVQMKTKGRMKAGLPEAVYKGIGARKTVPKPREGRSMKKEVAALTEAVTAVDLGIGMSNREIKPMKVKVRSVTALTEAVTAAETSKSDLKPMKTKAMTGTELAEAIAAAMGIGTSKRDLKPHEEIWMMMQLAALAEAVTAADLGIGTSKTDLKPMKTEVEALKEAVTAAEWTRNTDLKPRKLISMKTKARTKSALAEAVTAADLGIGAKKTLTKRRERKKTEVPALTEAVTEEDMYISVTITGKWKLEIRDRNHKSRIWIGSYSTREAAERAFEIAYNHRHDLPVMGDEIWTEFIKEKAAEVKTQVRTKVVVKRLPSVRSDHEEEVNGITGLLDRVNLNKLPDPKDPDDDDDLVKGIQKLEIGCGK